MIYALIIVFGILILSGFSKDKGMVVLKDSVTIDTSMDTLYQWFLNLDKNFVNWHPNHKTFELRSGGTEIGDKIYFEELVDGTLYKIEGKIITKNKLADNFTLAFKTSAGLGHIYFMGKYSGNTCVFTHIEEFGMRTPIIGSIVNFLLFRILARKKANWDLIHKDMVEDNKNLKEILET